MIFFREYRTHFHQHSPDNVTGAKNRLQTRINTGLAGDFSSLVCTTFAWFTSKDEVTNRLTANSDYGVSIVESFTPPKNWIPGQEINKDVYAVNTANIDAFVKENVKGVLNFTYEYKANTLDDDCLKLNELEVAAIDGVTSEESGGFLAWTDTDEELGVKNVVMGEDSGWKPTKKGIYIFRRGIQHKTEVHPDGDEFTYAGYYFVPAGDKINDDAETVEEDTYFKIVIGNDKYRAENEDPTQTPTAIQFDLAAPESALVADIEGGTVTINREDGTIEADTLKVYYVKETEVNEKNVTFKYEEETDGYNADAPYTDDNHPARLVVEYAAAVNAGDTVVDDSDPDNVVTTVYNASADAARKEVLYYIALGESNEATMAYKQALADYNYAVALAKARDALIDAAKDRAQAEADHNSAISNVDEAWENVTSVIDDDDRLETTYADLLATTGTDDLGKIAPTAIIADALRIYIDANAATLTSCKDNLDTLDNLWGNAATTGTILGTLKEVQDELDYLSTDHSVADDDLPNPNDVEAHLRTLKSKLATLESLLQDYSDTYADLALETTDLNLAGISLNDTDDTKDTIDGYTSKATNMLADVNKNAADGDLTKEVADYRTAYEAYIKDSEAGGDYDQAKAKWDEAKNTYNATVGHPDIDAVGDDPDDPGYVAAQDATGATKTYLDAIADDQRLNTHTDPGDNGDTEAIKDDDGDVINDTDYKYTDNRDKIVQYYSANRNTDAVDPTLQEYDGTKPTSLANGTWSDPVNEITTDYEYYAALTSVYTDDENNSAANPPVFGYATTTNRNVYAEPTGATFNTSDDVTYKAGDDALTDEVLLATLKGAMDDAVAETAKAKAAYDDAVTVLSGTSDIKLYVNLADGYDDSWTFDTNTDGTTQADFYLNSILNAGETSPMLIDSVTMDNGVSANSYKNLIFDLNVGLDSAQVTYADDQKTYTTTAVEGNSDIFKLKAAVQNDNETVTWTDVNAPTTP